MSKYILSKFNDPYLDASVFDYISYRNIVNFYKSRLKNVENAESIYNIFNSKKFEKLKKKGVLISVYDGKSNNRHTRKIIPSCLTRMILCGLIGDEDVDQLLEEVL